MGQPQAAVTALPVMWAVAAWLWWPVSLSALCCLGASSSPTLRLLVLPGLQKGAATERVRDEVPLSSVHL